MVKNIKWIKYAILHKSFNETAKKYNKKLKNKNCILIIYNKKYKKYKKLIKL